MTLDASGNIALKSATVYDESDRTESERTFRMRYPDYENAELDRLRATEYGRLDLNSQVYLDYTGGGLYGESQLERHFSVLRESVLGNPHSVNPTSLASTDLVESARRYVLEYFNASPDDYLAVFTPNASGALKHVGESYPFSPEGRFLLTLDNHNSVNGVREFARNKGAKFEYAPLTMPDLRIDRDALGLLLDSPGATGQSLFAFPAQSNFSGVKHPLEIVDEAQQKGWDVLLDAAAYAPTNRLDLSIVKPEFVALSFYKMFGYPTGVGCLLMKRNVLDRLDRPWFAGGTVNFATAKGDGHLLARGEAAFEDGTVDYLNLPGVEIGLRYLSEVGVERIGARVSALTGWLLENLLALSHGNGKPMVRIYGPADNVMRGGTITFNLYDPQHHLLDYRRIEELANDANISLRTGCFCNPGAGEVAEGLTREDMLEGLNQGLDIDLPRFVQIIEHRGNKSAGAVRVSVGIASNFEDVYRFMAFVASFRDRSNLNIGRVTFDIPGCRRIRDGS